MSRLWTESFTITVTSCPLLVHSVDWCKVQFCSPSLSILFHLRVRFVDDEDKRRRFILNDERRFKEENAGPVCQTRRVVEILWPWKKTKKYSSFDLVPFSVSLSFHPLTSHTPNHHLQSIGRETRRNRNCKNTRWHIGGRTFALTRWRCFEGKVHSFDFQSIKLFRNYLLLWILKSNWN